MATCQCCDVINELTDLLTLFNEHGSERGAVGDMTEEQRNRYRWALVHTKDRVKKATP